MKIKFFIGAATLFLGAALVQAGDVAPATNPSTTTNAVASTDLQHPKYAWLDPNNDTLYRNMELSLDAFGFGSVDQHTIESDHAHSYYHHNHLGVGAGVDFFFCRYVGVEVEGFSGSTSGNFVDDAGGNLVLRYPIGDTGLAPYVFGGGGHEWDPVSGDYWDGGIGLEYRFIKWFSIFADARYMATDHDGNYGMGRAGVRFTF